MILSLSHPLYLSSSAWGRSQWYKVTYGCIPSIHTTHQWQPQVFANMEKKTKPFPQLVDFVGVVFAPIKLIRFFY